MGMLTMDLKEIYLSASGRFSRRQFWLSFAVMFPFAFFITALVGGYDLLIFKLLVLTSWLSLFPQIKRWHDLGKSSWWVLLSFIPIYGTIWILGECGFGKGATGSNRFGPPATSKTGEYLKRVSSLPLENSIPSKPKGVVMQENNNYFYVKKRQLDLEVMVKALLSGESVIFSGNNSRENFALLDYLVRSMANSYSEFAGYKFFTVDRSTFTRITQNDLSRMVRSWMGPKKVVALYTIWPLLDILDAGTPQQLDFKEFFNANSSNSLKFIGAVDVDPDVDGKHLSFIKYKWKDFVYWHALEADPAAEANSSSANTGASVPLKPKIEAADIRNFDAKMNETIIGQKNAVAAVNAVLCKTFAGFSDQDKPRGVFYFVGPSGVGKTEFARQLAKFLYGSEDALKRIDMSEFSGDVDINRLIGSAPGYIGYDKGGALTEWVKIHPESVLLLDEFEKAHAKCWDICLQLFDAGRLTDGKGDTVNFSKTIIIMTSNIGSEFFGESDKKSVGFVAGENDKNCDSGDNSKRLNEIYQRILGKMHQIFRPEFLNRIDEIVMFEPLAPDSLNGIAQAIIKRKLPNVTCSPAVIQFLAEKGFSPEFGVRFLGRTIDRCIIEPLARFIIDGKFSKNDQLQIDINGDNFVFKRFQG